MRVAVPITHVAWPALRAWVLPPVQASAWLALVNKVNTTWPVGAPVPGAPADTVAVKVTLCPVTEGAADAASVVVVGAAVTETVTGLETEPR